MRIFFILISFLLITACKTISPNNNKYPLDITNKKESSNFPLKAKDFKRGKMILYSPQDISIGYNSYSQTNQISVTLYNYPSPLEHEDLFKKEISIIKKHNKSLKDISKSQKMYRKNGSKLLGKFADFSGEGIHKGVHQKIYTSVLLLKKENKYIKVRATSPLSRKNQTKNKVNELLSIINWNS